MSVLEEMMEDAAKLGLCEERWLHKGYVLKHGVSNYMVRHGFNHFDINGDFNPELIREKSAIDIDISNEAIVLLANFGRLARLEAIENNPLVREYTEYPQLFQPMAWHGIMWMNRFLKTARKPQYRQWKIRWYIRSYSRGDGHEAIYYFGERFNPPWDCYECKIYESPRYFNEQLIAKWDTLARLRIVSKDDAKRLKPNEWFQFTEHECYPLNGKSLPSVNVRDSLVQ